MKNSIKRALAWILTLCVLVFCGPLVALAEEASANYAEIEVEVAIEGLAPSPAENYVIRMTAEKAGNPMPAGITTLNCDVAVSGSGTAKFPPMVFDRVGVYHYTVAQVPGTNPNCLSYDNTVYKLAVFITRDDDGRLSLTAVADRDDSFTKPADFGFVNVYATATPEPTATATPEPTATATPEPTATATPEPTATATPEPTATATPEPTATATAEPTATATPEPTATATPEPTVTATATPNPGTPATAVPPAVVTATPEPTPTPVPVVAINGEKVWVDESNSHNTRPSSITVQLYANGVPVNATPSWGSTSGNTWRFSFGELPAVDEAGQGIVYTVREVAVNRYESSVSGMTITNSLIPSEPSAYTSISGTKTWDDDDNMEGLRPNYVTVRLMQNGTEIERRTVTAANGWQYTFNDLPVDDGYGNNYTYAIREDGVTGYFPRYNGYNITNMLLENPDLFDITNYRTPLAGELQYTNEESLEDLLMLFDYSTPLWGELLTTGEETPAYPYVFGAVGLLALIGLLALNRRRRAN